MKLFLLIDYIQNRMHIDYRRLCKVSLDYDFDTSGRVARHRKLNMRTKARTRTRTCQSRPPETARVSHFCTSPEIITLPAKHAHAVVRFQLPLSVSLNNVSIPQVSNSINTPRPITTIKTFRPRIRVDTISDDGRTLSLCK